MSHKSIITAGRGAREIVHDALEERNKTPKKGKSLAKPAKKARLRAFWGVCNEALRRVALFEFSQENEARKKAEELSVLRKSSHFVQLVKEVVEE
jgi:hypothetical protein